MVEKTGKDKKMRVLVGSQMGACEPQARIIILCNYLLFNKLYEQY